MEDGRKVKLKVAGLAPPVKPHGTEQRGSVEPPRDDPRPGSIRTSSDLGGDDSAIARGSCRAHWCTRSIAGGGSTARAGGRSRCSPAKVRTDRCSALRGERGLRPDAPERRSQRSQRSPWCRLASREPPAGHQGLQGPKGDKGDPGVNGATDSAQAVLDKIKQVDGSGSGLDADTIDGAAAVRKVGTATGITRIRPAATRTRIVRHRGPEIKISSVRRESAPATVASPTESSTSPGRSCTPSATRPPARSIRPRRGRSSHGRQVNHRGWALRTAAMASRTRSSGSARAARTVASSCHGSAIPALSPASPSRTPRKQNGL